MNGCKLTAIIAAGVGAGIIIAFLVLAFLIYIGNQPVQQQYYATPTPACGSGHVEYGYNNTPYCAYP